MSLFKARVLLTIAAIVTFGGGLQSLYESALNTKPRSMTCDEFLKMQPTSGWYHVTGAYMDLNNGASFTAGGDAPGYGTTANYCCVALRSASDKPDSPVRVFLRTEDPNVLNDMKYHEGDTGGVVIGTPGPPEPGSGPPAPASSVWRPADVTGMIDVGFADDAPGRRLARGANAVDPHFVVLNDKLKPNALKAIGLIVAGLGLGYASFLAWRSAGE